MELKYELGGIEILCIFQGFVLPRTSCKIRPVTQQFWNLSPSLLSLGLAFHTLPSPISYTFSNEEKGSLVVLQSTGGFWSCLVTKKSWHQEPMPAFCFLQFTFLEMVRTLASPWPCSRELPISLEAHYHQIIFIDLMLDDKWIWTCIPILVTMCGLRKPGWKLLMQPDLSHDGWCWCHPMYVRVNVRGVPRKGNLSGGLLRFLLCSLKYSLYLALALSFPLRWWSSTVW